MTAMIKKELLAMQPLKATPDMLRIAAEDTPHKTSQKSYWGYTHVMVTRRFDLYLRCHLESGILKAALYHPDVLRGGGDLPAFEVFIDKEAHRFLSYDQASKKWLTAKLDRLDWPMSVGWSPKCWVSDTERKIIHEYFGTTEDGYNDILKFQLQIREEELERRDRKQLDGWDADMALTPALPRDWERWVDKVGIPENFIFYRYARNGAKEGFCTCCGRDVPLREKPRHAKEGICPRCRRKVTYKSIGRLGYQFMTDMHCVYLIQAIPDGFMVREFWAERRYTRENYRTPEVLCMEHWRTIYDSQLNYRYYYWGDYKGRAVRWIAGAPSCSWMGRNSIYCNHGNQPGRVYGKTLPHLARYQMKQCGFVEWARQNQMVLYPDGYLMSVQKYPKIEQLCKAGLYRLTKECLGGNNVFPTLLKDPNASGLTRALGVDSQELGRLRRKNGGSRFLCWLQHEKQSGKPLPDELIDWYCEQKLEPNDIQFVVDRMNPVQIHNYLMRQSAVMDDSVRSVLNTWKDYLSMAEQLGLDTSDAIIYRVNRLQQRHDELVVRLQREDMEEQAAEILKEFLNVDRICQSLREKFEYANETYAVVAPGGVLDIIVEGSMLHHCVGSSKRYWDRIERNEAYILFLRRKEAPDVPYYTLEVEPDGTVRQKRTKFDRQEADIQEVSAFLVEWQKVVSERLTKRDRRLASDSRTLREQEFKQMRKDDVRINVGDLAGQRLVDVLTADLMENAA